MGGAGEDRDLGGQSWEHPGTRGSSVNCLPHDVHLCPKEGFIGTWCEHRGPQLTYEAAV